MMLSTERTETVEPFNDGEEIEISYKPYFSKWKLVSKMPKDMPERLEDGEPDPEDIAYLEWIIDEHTNRKFMELISDSPLEEKTEYLIELVVSEIVGKDIESWEEREGADYSFIDGDNLGAR